MINTLQILCLKRWLDHSPKPGLVLHLTEVRRKSAHHQGHSLGAWTGGIAIPITITAHIYVFLSVRISFHEQT